MADKEIYVIGVDTGGTFTDCVVLDETGNVTIGKAETTPGILEEGVLGAIADAASHLGLTLERLLDKTRAVNQGTTVGTNILINRDGARAGLITTEGFEDTIYVQRAVGRIDGLSPDEIRHQATCRKPEPVIPKELIYGVTERIDCFGKVAIPLNRRQVEEAVDELKAHGVEAIGVCLLWGFLNPSHEQEIEKIIHERAPEVFCNISSRIAPTIREYGRTNTVVIDAYVGPPMIKWYRNLKNALKGRGYRHELLTMQVWGGVMPAESMMPIGTINSGPAGGVVGSRLMGSYLGLDNVVTTDVGGTSFDVSLVAEGKPIAAREPPIMRYRISIPTIEVISIGAGGGTVAWIDAAGLFKVGPVSAGSLPGPVSYGRGGKDPTVTDADLVLGYFNPDYFLGGKLKLDKEAAEDAIRKLGEEMGWGLIETARAIFTIQNEHMTDLLRLMVTRRGYDPRDFVVFAFGGGGPAHAAFYSAPLSIKSIYMFPESAVFSAYGIATSDIQRIFNFSMYARLPGDNEDIAKRLTSAYQDLDKKALAEMELIGFRREDVMLSRSISMKFARQVNMESIDVPVNDYVAADIDDIQRRFIEYYTRLYGEGAAFVEAGMEIMAQSVTATILSPAAPPASRPLGSADGSKALKGKRNVYWEKFGDFHSTGIYDFQAMMPGNTIKGPSIIEAATTTLVIPPDLSAMMNEYGQVVVELE
ncbi:MAG: hydantoinase/oxoprolinase family protein [Thermodesulfobacteriota bacterium]|nr:hydantoinase/oxoprolinase family protein [Thermodesulfobacteriota bacterium]